MVATRKYRRSKDAGYIFERYARAVEALHDRHVLLSVLEVLVEVDPGRVEALRQYLSLAHALEGRRRTIKRAQRLQKLHQRSFDVQFEVYSYLDKRGEHAGALSAIVRAVKLRPGELDARRELGRAYLIAGKREAAIAALAAFLPHAHSPYDGHIEIASAYHDLGLVKQAARQYRQALALASHKVLASQKGRASVLLQPGRLQPGANRRAALRGLSDLALGPLQHDRALMKVLLARWSAVLETSSTDAEAVRAKRGDAGGDSNRAGRSEAGRRRSRLRMAHEEALRYLVEIHSTMGDLDDAMRAWRVDFERDPPDRRAGELLLTVAFSERSGLPGVRSAPKRAMPRKLSKKEQLAAKKSRAIAARMTTHFPNDAFLWITTAKLERLNGDYRRALRAYEKAAALDLPRSTEIYLLMADLAALHFDAHEARKYWQQALKSSNNDRHVLTRYAQFENKHGHYREAAQLFERAIKERKRRGRDGGQEDGFALAAANRIEFELVSVYQQLGDLKRAHRVLLGLLRSAKGALAATIAKRQLALAQTPAEQIQSLRTILGVLEHRALSGQADALEFAFMSELQAFIDRRGAAGTYAPELKTLLDLSQPVLARVLTRGGGGRGAKMLALGLLELHPTQDYLKVLLRTALSDRDTDVAGRALTTYALALDDERLHGAHHATHTRQLFEVATQRSDRVGVEAARLLARATAVPCEQIVKQLKLGTKRAGGRNQNQFRPLKAAARRGVLDPWQRRDTRRHDKVPSRTKAWLHVALSACAEGAVADDARLLLVSAIATRSDESSAARTRHRVDTRVPAMFGDMSRAAAAYALGHYSAKAEDAEALWRLFASRSSLAEKNAALGALVSWQAVKKVHPLLIEALFSRGSDLRSRVTMVLLGRFTLKARRSAFAAGNGRARYGLAGREADLRKLERFLVDFAIVERSRRSTTKASSGVARHRAQRCAHDKRQGAYCAV